MAEPSELPQINKRLRDIDEKLGVVQMSVVRIETACKPCREQVARHSKMLIGNEGEGLGTRMVVVEGGLERLHESKTKWYWMFVGSAFAFVVTVLASLSVAIASGVFR